MPRETREWIVSLRSIENEYRVAFIGMARLSDQARHDPAILGPGLRLRDVDEARRHLNATYAIRLFAEFETGLRHFWTTTRNEPEPRRIAETIDRIASRHRVFHSYLRNCHRVRQYRNRQVHQSEEVGETLEVRECCSYLCTFLGRMPPDWKPPTP